MLRNALLVGLVLGQGAQAAYASEQPQGFFIGARADASTIDIDDDSNQAAGVELNAGYMINPYVGFSTSYGNSFDLLEDIAGLDDDFDRVDAFVIGRYPLSEYAGINLGVGAVYAQSDYSPAAQLFIDYKLADAWYLNAGYKHFIEPMDQDEDISAFQVGAQYFFGVEPVEQVKPAPKPIITPPPPKPEPVPEPEYQVHPEQHLMVHFKFDSTQVVDNAALTHLYEQLNSFVDHSERNQRDYEIVIEGYADPQGPEDYNLLLSKRRAEYLQQYLINKGIDAQKINLVIGRGEIVETTNQASRRVVVTYTEL